MLFHNFERGLYVYPAVGVAGRLDCIIRANFGHEPFKGELVDLASILLGERNVLSNNPNRLPTGFSKYTRHVACEVSEDGTEVNLTSTCPVTIDSR